MIRRLEHEQPAHPDLSKPTPASDLPDWLQALRPPAGSKPLDDKSEDEVTAFLETLEASTQTSKPSSAEPLKPISESPSTPSPQEAADELAQALASSQKFLDEALQFPSIEIKPPDLFGAPKETGALADAPKAGGKKNQCPHCGVELQGAPGQGFIFCYHCGSQVIF
jgi:hypothetical protein